MLEACLITSQRDLDDDIHHLSESVPVVDMVSLLNSSQEYLKMNI